ncbi:MAG TPA: hypothetical protein PKC73_00335 [Dermatophilaceae bacterium]|nr:hypothetical protein [Dermatophilaceae bacterium]
MNSAGRTVAEQQGLINRWNKGGTANRPPYLYKPAMPATASNHVSNGGVAVDIGDWRRFAQVCTRYGFRHSYPDSDPVHFDYVGGAAAGGGGNSFNQTIKDQQQWLIDRGYNLGASGADGVRGPSTIQAFKQYQTFLRAFGYSGDIDGDWGPGTQAAHNAYATSLNNANAELKAQQQWLISRNYNLGPKGADGVWGPSTEAAFKQYQQFLRAYGYTGDIDGQWGPGTQEAHAKYYAEVTSPPPASGAPAFPLPAGKYFGPEADPNSISGYHSYSGELRQWQQRMSDRGWPITVDGLYGFKGDTTPRGNTAEVTVAFQKEKGLTPDGLIGPATWTAAWTAPVTTTPPTPSNPNPTTPPVVTPPVDDELAATPNLVTPTAAHFPSWIRFEIVTDPEGQKANLNKEAAEYYGVPYNPVETHLHWWNLPGQGGTHDGNVNYIKNTKDLSVNFVLSENRITLMVPINKIALTTGKRNPYAWKVENDPTLSEQQYKTMGYLVYIVEKLNPALANAPLRLHKEFYSTSCSEISKDKVREYAEKFRTGLLDPSTGLPIVVTPPVDPPIDPPVDPEPEPEVPADMVLVSKAFLKNLSREFRSLADDLDDLAK